MASLARVAGVTKSTVSKALNGGSGVSEETRLRIRALSASLDFHPHASASALARRRSGAIALAIPVAAEPFYEGSFWTAFISAAVSSAARRGLRTVILTPGAGDAGAEGFEAALRQRSVDGLVVAPEILDRRCLGALLSERVPYLRLGEPDTLGAPAVDVDNEGGARRMTELILASGRRRIAFLARSENLGYMAARETGFSSALKACPSASARMERSPYDAFAARAVVRSLIGSAFAPDALFVGAGGPLMLGALEGWRDCGGAGSGVALAVFDDSPLLGLMDPPVSAVRQPIAEMAEAAIAALIDSIEGRPVGDAVVLDTRIVARGALAGN